MILRVLTAFLYILIHLHTGLESRIPGSLKTSEYFNRIYIIIKVIRLSFLTEQERYDICKENILFEILFGVPCGFHCNYWTAHTGKCVHTIQRKR